MRVGKQSALLSRESCRLVEALIKEKLSGMELLKTEAAAKMDRSVMNYWDKYGHYAGRNEELLEELKEKEVDNLFLFPGREMERTPFKFDGKDKSDCMKKFFTGRPNMSSFISLQCSWRHPKIIGFTLISEIESIAMSISTVLDYLNLLPRTSWYDNACNF